MVSLGKVMGWCVALVMVVVMVLVTPSEGFYGQGNIMRRLYPNGPSEYWNMRTKKHGGYEYYTPRGQAPGVFLPRSPATILTSRRN